MTLKHIISPEKRRRKLKQLLENNGFARGIEVHSAISALIANDLRAEINGGRKINEFDFFWESSFTDSASKGYPDIEIISFDSRLKTISEILEVTDKPLIIDGDTGGDIHHFEYLIPRLEAAGVSAIIIEDKKFPKRNSLESGTKQDQEDPEDFANKIRTGKKIQKSEDFMIIARIESLISGKTVEDALIRAKKYLEAGVDGIMIHSKSSEPDKIFEFSDKYKRLCQILNLQKPLVSVPTTYNSVNERELKDKGFSLVIYANHMLRASYEAMKKVGKIILENERSLEVDPFIAPVREIFEKVGFLEIKEKDKVLIKTPSVIIPSGGEHPEIRDFLKEIPKAMVKINGRPLLEHQVNLLKKVGLNDIHVVRGHKKDKINVSGVNYFDQEDYSSAGVVNGIMVAKEKMKNGFVYLSGDVLIDEKLIKELLGRKEDIVLVVDSSYLYHKHDVDKQLDAVVTKKGSQHSYQKLRKLDDEVIMIGKKIPRDLMTHEFMGLAKFTKQGAENLIKVYEDCKLNHKGEFHESESFLKAKNPDMFQELINRGFTIAVHETNGGWLELHNEKDFELAKEMLK